MATNSLTKKGSTLSQEAIDDNAISDYRKSSRSFGVIARGVTAANTDEVCSAIMFDVLAGKVQLQEAAALYKGMEQILHHDDQTLQREEMALRTELLKRRSNHLKAGRELMEMRG
jgi:hypothetical protein